MCTGIGYLQEVQQWKLEHLTVFSSILSSIFLHKQLILAQKKRFHAVPVLISIRKK
jgi:hypothetical protein